MAKDKPIRLLLVDDHEIVRLGLKTLFARDAHIHIVGEAGSSESAIREATRLRPDVVLMDVRLPDGTGIEACREIRSACPETRVLFLTTFADEEAVLATVMAGAAGYLLKEIDSDPLLRAVRQVAKGQSILDPAVTQRVLAKLHSRTSGESGEKDESEPLTPQERRVLALVAEGKTNKEIANDMNLSDKTVKNYLGNIFQKLHVTRRSQAAAWFVRRSPN